jgi:hypothetical protein
MSIFLTADQKLAIDRGEVVSITIEGRSCVILTQDKYENVRAGTEPLSPEQRRFLLQQAGMRAGWGDPEMAVYDDLDPRKT